MSKYRLITRSDFDGIASAVLLKHLDMIDEIKFVHPKDMQDGKIPVTARDITTNLPYVPGVHLAFDHHSSESFRLSGTDAKHYINKANAPSAARVVFDHYGGAGTFPPRLKAMMDGVDKADSAQFTKDEVLNPTGWVLLSFLMDSRTGLGRFCDFRIPNYQLMMDLTSLCGAHTIEEILQMPDVKERAQIYFDHQIKFRDQLKRCTTVHKNLALIDLRQEMPIWPGNRFMIYALFPKCNISMHVMWGLKKQNTVCATGKSIFNRTSNTDIGALMFKYGGGGHAAAGTCQLENDVANAKIKELIAAITTDG